MTNSTLIEAADRAYGLIAPHFAAELQKTPNDNEGAWIRAVAAAKETGAFDSVGWSLFPERFFSEYVKPLAIARIQKAEARCEQFTADITKILDTFSSDCPFFSDFVLDADGKPWPIPPSKMTVGDILAFVQHRYGEMFVGFCRQFDQLKVH
jgi:hypothetical protein